MAQCTQSAHEFIQSAFCPMVAVMCSEDAEKICQKNNLSFVEMVRPFCHLTSEAHIRDPSGVIHPVKNWRIRLVEMSATHPPQHVVNKLLSEVVSRTQPINTDPNSYTPEVQVKASTPWFEAFRDCFFQLVKPSDHEFIRHFLACLIVVSSQHADPMNAFATMSSQQIEQQSEHHGHFKWFSSTVFKYHLLLHDVSGGEESKAEAVYQSMKSVYGQNACHLLQINSVYHTGSNPRPNLPDPWSQFIIPTGEDSLILSRRGLHRSLFSATRKWFGGSKPAGLASRLVPGIIYSSDAPELYQRKLGDLAFLVQNYEFAYNCYHTAKREFNNEHAWFYFAGSLEMAAVSAFMTSQRPYPTHYMETAIKTYLNACRQHQFAIRATLLSTEALKSRNVYLDSALQFMRMTAEESDLLCALLLEQAAHCFLHSNPPMIRKYAFNMILAGHRYSKSAQVRLNCTRRKKGVKRCKIDFVPKDHINFTLGRQSFNLRLLEDAQIFFRQLLEYESLQEPEQQASYLREFLFVFKQLCDMKQKDKSQVNDLPVLPLPVIQQESTRVIPCYQHSMLQSKHQNERLLDGSVGTTNNFFNQSLPLNNQIAKNSNWTSIGLCSFADKFDPKVSRHWIQLEEETHESVSGVPLPPSFRPHVPCLSSKTDNSSRPHCVVKETVGVEVFLKNPLKIPLNLTNLLLLWKFTPKDQATSVSNEVSPRDDVVKTEVITNFDINGSETKAAHFALIPCQAGQLCITGVKYRLSSVAINGPIEEKFSTPPLTNSAMSAVSILGRLELEVKGPRLNNTKAEKTSVIHGNDNRLKLDVVPAMPLLEVSFSGFPSNLLCNEVVQTVAEFTNCSDCCLEKLYITTPNPEFFTFGGISSSSEPNGKATGDFPKCKLSASDIRRVSEVPLPGNRLAPGYSTKLPVWIQGRKKAGKSIREVLFYYLSSENTSPKSYRVLQHAFEMTTNSSVAVRATARRNRHSPSSDDQNQLIVALDVESVVRGDIARKFLEFSVVQVSCASRNWTLEPLSHHKTDGVVQVRYGETAVVQFKASKRQADLSSSSDDLHFSHVCFVKDEIPASCSPWVDFFFRSESWQEQRNLAQSQLSAETTSYDTSQVDIGLIVFWQTSYIDKDFQKQLVNGQNHVTISRLAETVSAVTQAAPVPLPESSSSSETASPPSAFPGVSNSELLVKYSLRHPARVQLDFNTSRLAWVAVELVLHNCCSLPVDVFVELFPRVGNSRPSTETSSGNTTSEQSIAFDSESDLSSKPSLSSFTWVGQTSKRVRLESNGSSSFKFNALISLPGVYNMNNLRVLAKISELHEPEGSLILQKPCPPSFVVVENNFKTHNWQKQV
ncbi:PREDICTED: trafficking protein particle complex subunit 8-like [Acropora digitifera]|uniref:trafficking protein particle complex subunit 8-like n=1 Tax=Acropora digitifera TaxID=70779 RepID=UPI00077A53BC|nr:PREDICTED: trafficking protein particle complex subunit 8-like [Acropora digitifera]